MSNVTLSVSILYKPSFSCWIFCVLRILPPMIDWQPNHRWHTGWKFWWKWLELCHFHRVFTGTGVVASQGFTMVSHNPTDMGHWEWQRRKNSKINKIFLTSHLLVQACWDTQFTLQTQLGSICFFYLPAKAQLNQIYSQFVFRASRLSNHKWHNTVWLLCLFCFSVLFFGSGTHTID